MRTPSRLSDAAHAAPSTIAVRHSGARRASIGLAAACLLAATLPLTLHAAPLLRCQLDQGGEQRLLEVAPVADPYSVAAIDLNGRFRFKAVVVGDAKQVEYVKLYVYIPNSRQPMLIHQSTYLAPAARADASPASLTGVNHVYSPRLERELQYGCALLETTP